MQKELIMKLIDKAREASDNAYCPYTNTAVGCALLTDDNVIFTGCNIEFRELSSCASAGDVTVLKAISEAYTKFKAVCFFSAETMPFPGGSVAGALGEFNPMIEIIVATDETYSIHNLYELFPFLPEGPRIE